jgi:predicted TIM-barrel fold metal-dependent hydrolase
MPQLEFFDGCAMVGWRSDRHPETIWHPDDFLADYQYYGINAALVHHAVAVEYHQDYGNRRLLEEIAGRPRLIPQWVLMPHHTHEIAPADELIPQMLGLGVRSARIFPKMHGFPTSDDVCGPLFTALQEHRIPLFADVSELSIDEAAKLCERYPELPMVLCGIAWGSDRVLEPALERTPNLHVETHAFQGHRAYERIVEQFGAERLIFGTGLPNCSPGAAMMMCLYEDISEQDRAKIAGGNLLRLLNEVRTDQPSPLTELAPYPEREDDDAIVRCLRVGEPLDDEFVFDAHGHLAHDGSMGIARLKLAYNDAEHLVQTMDRLGIDRCLISSWSGITLGDPAGNDITLSAVERYPDRLLGYGCINPRYPEVMREEFERVFVSGKMQGYKPYPPKQAVPITDLRHRLVLEWCDRQGLPVLCHGGMSGDRCVSPEHLDKVAPLYPNAKFLLAHTGSSWALAEALVPVARKHSNIYAEITYTSITYGMIEYLVREIGRERVLFGTDCVMRDAAPQLGWVAWARIPIEDKRMVLGGNIADILGLPPEQRQSLTGALKPTQQATVV